MEALVITVDRRAAYNRQVGGNVRTHNPTMPIGQDRPIFTKW